MSLINPFSAIRPQPKYAQDLLAPPYDVVSRAQAYELAHNAPLSFLHISKPEIDLPLEVDQYDAQVYAKGMENYRKLLSDGILQQDPEPCFYLYRLGTHDHQQTGLIAAVSVEAYNKNQVRKHELTRHDKEEDRVKHLSSINAQTSPVLLAHRDNTEINTLIAKLSQQKPLVNVTDENQVQHEFWCINDLDSIKQLNQLYNQLDTLYIADGHHRSAAASIVAAKRDKTMKQHHAPHHYFLSVLFPASQLRILSYNRIVSDLYDLNSEQFLAKLQQCGDLKECADPVYPQQAGEIGLYLASCWYSLRFKPNCYQAGNMIANLDVSLVEKYLFNDLLGIQDSRKDQRVNFIGGLNSIANMTKAVDAGEAALAISLYPTRIDDLMTIADKGNIMPPKSTWFEPKLADGLVCLSLDDDSNSPCDLESLKSDHI